MPINPRRLLVNISISADASSLKNNNGKRLIVPEKTAKSCGSRADKMMEVRSYKLSEYIIYSYDGGGKLSWLTRCLLQLYAIHSELFLLVCV